MTTKEKAMPKTTTIDPIRTNPLTSLLESLHQAKEAQARAAERVKAVQEEMIQAMEADGLRTYRAHGLTGTIVRAERTVIDEDKLAELVDSETWSLITKRVVDKEKLEAAAVLGTVTPEVLGQSVSLKPNAPYITVKVDERNR